LPAKKESTSGQVMGFAQTLSTGSEYRHTASPAPRSPVPSKVLDEMEQYKFDSLAVTVTNSSRAPTNDKLPNHPVPPPELSSQVQVPGTPSPLDSQQSLVPISIGTPSPPDVKPSPVQLSIRTPSPEDPVQREQVAYKAIQRLFSRASHLIRESSELHGIIFVDASLQDIAVTDDAQKSSLSPANTPRFGDIAGTSMNMNLNLTLTEVSNDLPLHIRRDFRAQVESPPGRSKAPVCQLLGYSLQTDSGRGDAAPSTRQLGLPQSTLRDLLRRYPNGHVFLFNADGSLLDDEMKVVARGELTGRSQSPPKNKSKFEREKEQLRAYQLLHICPDARGIIFIPLWDPQRDQVRTVSKLYTHFHCLFPPRWSNIG
jgi:hypothetical protein